MLTTKNGKNYLAIDLGGHSIKLVYGVYKQGKLKIMGTHSMRLPEGCVDNGLIINEGAVENAIGTLIKQCKIKEKEAILTIDSTEIIKRELLIPKVELQDLPDLITYEISQYLPIDVNNYVLQYKVIGEVLQGEQAMYQVFLGAMPRDMAKQHFHLIQRCGLVPIALDVHTNSITKLISVLGGVMQDNLRETVAYIDFGYDRTDLNFFEDGVNRLNRVIRMGFHEIDRINAQEQGIDIESAEDQRLKLANESLLTLRKAYEAHQNFKESENASANIAQTDSKMDGQPLIRQMDYLEMLLDEVEKVFKFYQTRAVDRPITKVVTYGGGSLAKDFNRYLQDRLDINCSVLDVTHYEIVNFKVIDDSPVKYVNAIGALIR